MAGDLLGAGGFGLRRAAAHGQRLLGVGQLALELAALLDQRGDARRDFVGRGFERGGGFAQLVVAGVEPLARAFAGQRLDPADARRDRAFADDLEDGDVAGGARRGCRRTARPNNAVSVSRPMLSTRTSSPYFSPNSAIAPAATASSGVISRVATGWLARISAFTSASIAAISSARQRLGVREIEAQPVGRDQAALLGDVAAEAVAQRGVEQMGRAMVGADRGAALGIDRLVEACRRP